MRPLTRHEATVLADLDDIGQAETMREHVWHMLPLQERERAMGVAGLTREQAHWPMAQFSEGDRERVRLAVTRHVMNMDLIVQCMAPNWSTPKTWLH